MPSYTREDVSFCKLAIEQSRLSIKDGAFPAGAVLVKNGTVEAKTISAKWPEIIYHSESNAIDEVMGKKHQQLTGYTLYASMHPCLMCLSRAYWAGIRRIVYAVPKIPDFYQYYEGRHDPAAILTDFNETMEVVRVKELEDEAVSVVREWERSQSP